LLNTWFLILYFGIESNWNVIKLILTKSTHSDLL
jgi:hypothetical protein